MNNTETNNQNRVLEIKNSNIAVSVYNVWKSYESGKIKVLSDVNLQIKKGELVALWGVSGSGKSTLLHLIGGLDTIDNGRITTADLDPTNENERLELRRNKVGFIFQLHNLIPDLTLGENCLIPTLTTNISVPESRKRLNELIEMTGLQDRLHHRIQDLSGGERQRAAICRALINNPMIILADEPTGSLDEETGSQIFSLFKKLIDEKNITVIMATHERRFAEECDKIFKVKNGKVSQI